MPRAVVLGGAGFIGSHLVDRLVREGWSVVVVDDVSTGTWDNGTSWPAAQVARFAHDISLPLPFSLLKGPSVDVVIHLASPASPLHYRRLSLETLRVNSIGTERALALCQDLDARFVYVSTSEVYGDPDVSPQPEEYWGRVNSVGPRACYYESKRFGEALTIEYVRRTKVSACIVRLFNCYGPRMLLEDGRVVPNFMAQALRREPLTIYGSGLQTRSFCYVDDMIEALYRVTRSKALSGEVLNVGNPEEITIAELARLVADIAESPLMLRYLPLPEDDPNSRRPDIGKAWRLIQWTPSISLRPGLERTWRYFLAKWLRTGGISSERPGQSPTIFRGGSS